MVSLLSNLNSNNMKKELIAIVFLMICMKVGAIDWPYEFTQKFYPEGTRWTEIRLDTTKHKDWFSKKGDVWLANYEVVEYYVTKATSMASSWDNAQCRFVWSHRENYPDSLCQFVCEDITADGYCILASFPMLNEDSTYDSWWGLDPIYHFGKSWDKGQSVVYTSKNCDMTGRKNVSMGVVTELGEAYFGGISPLQYIDVEKEVLRGTERVKETRRIIDGIGVTTWDDGECIFGPNGVHSAMYEESEMRRHLRSMLVHFERGGEVLYDMWPEALGAEEPQEIDYNDFAFRLLEQMQQKTEGENVVCSPLSMQLAMGMLTNGAAGQTLRQIQQTMGTAGHSVDEVNAYYEQLMRTLGQPQTLPEWAAEVGYTEEHLPQLASANGIWACVPLYEQFVKTNQTFYDAELHEGVNFGLQETMDGIDQWVSDKTRGTIPSINEQPDEYITSMLINALYFRGMWETQFEKYETSNRIFTNSDGTEVMVPMMYQGKGVAYAELPTCRAVRLPYFKGDGHGRYYMTVFLPNDDAGNFTLNEEIWKQAQQTQDMQLVALRLPRFAVDAEAQMKDVLRDMGIRDAFSGLADFSAMSPVPLFVSKIKQLCHIAVDEKGTEASAATVISMEGYGVIPDYKDFTVDRPFCFTIEDDETGTVLFAGKINQLEQSADVEIGEYQPFAQNGKVWKMGWFYGGSDEAQMVEYHYLDGDTLVGGRRCKKMMRLEVRPSGEQTSYMGAMYEGGRLVYMALPGREEFSLLYDFVSEKGMRVDVYDPLQNDKAWMVAGATSASNTERYKGRCQTMRREDSYTFDWMVGVGYVGFYNMPLLTTGSALRLMECRLGDEVLYRDDSLHDGLTPSDAEVRRNKLDFTHVVKSQPKAPRRNAERTESEALAGEYSVKSFYVNFLPLSGTYTVTLTDGQGTAVYSKQVQTDNVLALEADLSRYAAGDYTLTVENDREAYTAAFSHKEGSGISPLTSTPRGGDILYDLQGRRLNTVPEKGLYIINGRKIMIP